MNQPLRRATTDDLNSLYQLETQCFSYDQIGRRSFARLLQSSSVHIWVIDQPGTETALLAYAIVLTRRNSRIRRLYSMATHPDARGQGLARRLLTSILAQASQEGYRIRLEVKCDNYSALKLYRQLGFEVIDVLPGYYSDGTDGYRMQCSVAEHQTL